MNYSRLLVGALIALIPLGYIAGRITVSTENQRKPIQKPDDAKEAPQEQPVVPVVLETAPQVERSTPQPTRGVNPAEAVSDPDTEQVAERAAVRTAEIEKRLKTESRDRAWATETEDKIRDAAKAIAGDKGRYTLKEVTCLTSICAVEISIPDLKGPQGNMHGFPFSVPGMAGFDFSEPERSSDGRYGIRYKFFRQGYPAPGGENSG